jgi:repressor LexA
MALTTKQEKVFRYVAESIEKKNISPSIRDIAAGIGSSSINGVHKMVQTLIARGLLARNKDGLLVLGDAAKQMPSTTSLPLLGYISAGLPMEESEGAEHIDLGNLLLGPEHYLLKVNGDSMQEDGILDGALVVIKPAKQVRNGDLVVALVDNTATTLKRLFHEKDGKIRLQPANSDYLPQFYAADRVVVQGTVVGVVSHLQGAA